MRYAPIDPKLASVVMRALEKARIIMRLRQMEFSVEDIAAGRHELDGPRERFLRDLGETAPGLLRGRVIEAVSRHLLPAPDPAPAEPAVSVEEEQRLARGGRHPAEIAHRGSLRPDGPLAGNRSCNTLGREIGEKT